MAIIIFGIISAGGIDAVIANAGKFSDYVFLASTHNVVTGKTSSYGFLTIVSTLAWELGYFGMPHILLRFMAIDSPEKLKISRRIGTIWVVIAMGIAIFIGIVGYGMIANGSLGNFFDSAKPEEASAVSETIIIKIATLLSENGVFFALFAGVVMAGIFASTIFILSSIAIVAVSLLTKAPEKEITDEFESVKKM